MAEHIGEAEISNAIRLDQPLSASKGPIARWQRKALETSCNKPSNTSIVNNLSLGKKYLVLNSNATILI